MYRRLAARLKSVCQNRCASTTTSKASCHAVGRSKNDIALWARTRCCRRRSSSWKSVRRGPALWRWSGDSQFGAVAHHGRDSESAVSVARGVALRRLWQQLALWAFDTTQLVGDTSSYRYNNFVGGLEARLLLVPRMNLRAGWGATSLIRSTRPICATIGSTSRMSTTPGARCGFRRALKRICGSMVRWLRRRRFTIGPTKTGQPPAATRCLRSTSMPAIGPVVAASRDKLQPAR